MADITYSALYSKKAVILDIDLKVTLFHLERFTKFNASGSKSCSDIFLTAINVSLMVAPETKFKITKVRIHRLVTVIVRPPATG